MLTSPIIASQNKQTISSYKGKTTGTTLHVDELDQNQSEKTDGMAIPIGRYP